jgi:hypothetical protein
LTHPLAENSSWSEKNVCFIPAVLLIFTSEELHDYSGVSLSVLMLVFHCLPSIDQSNLDLGENMLDYADSDELSYVSSDIQKKFMIPAAVHPLVFEILVKRRADNELLRTVG